MNKGRKHILFPEGTVLCFLFFVFGPFSESPSRRSGVLSLPPRGSLGALRLSGLSELAGCIM